MENNFNNKVIKTFPSLNNGIVIKTAEEKFDKRVKENRENIDCKTELINGNNEEAEWAAELSNAN